MPSKLRLYSHLSRCLQGIDRGVEARPIRGEAAQAHFLQQGQAALPPPRFGARRKSCAKGDDVRFDAPVALVDTRRKV